VSAPGQEIGVRRQRTVRGKLRSIGEHGHPPAVRGIDDLRQRGIHPVMLDAPVIASSAARGRWFSAATTSSVSKVPSFPDSTYRQVAVLDQGSRLA